MKPQDWMAKAEKAAGSAKVLLDIGDVDGACNRAYYAMFDAARAALLARGHEVGNDGRTHKGVLHAFSEHLVKNGPMPKDTGRLLKQAEARRYVADYERGPIESDDARQMIEQAQAFIATIRAALLAQDVGGVNTKP